MITQPPLACSLLTPCSELAGLDRKVLGTSMERTVERRQARKVQLENEIQMLSDNIAHARSIAGGGTGSEAAGVLQ